MHISNNSFALLGRHNSPLMPFSYLMLQIPRAGTLEVSNHTHWHTSSACTCALAPHTHTHTQRNTRTSHRI